MAEIKIKVSTLISILALILIIVAFIAGFFIGLAMPTQTVTTTIYLTKTTREAITRIETPTIIKTITRIETLTITAHPIITTFIATMTTKKGISVNDIGIYWNYWNIYPQQGSDVYYAVANFEIVNYGGVSACVIVAIIVKHEEHGIYEHFKIGERISVDEPVVRYGYFLVPPGSKKCEMSFSFLNPEHLDVYLYITVDNVFPAG